MLGKLHKNIICIYKYLAKQFTLNNKVYNHIHEECLAKDHKADLLAFPIIFSLIVCLPSKLTHIIIKFLV